MKALYAIIALLFLTSPVWTPRLAPNDYEGGRSRSVRDRTIRNTSAAAMILGEMRATTSDMLFIKTERYLDYGVAYEPHLDEVIKSVSSESQDIEMHLDDASGEGHDHAHDHGDDGHTPATIIRTVDRDFRGIIGELERRVQPWRDPSLPHQHADGREMLPWYRVMTLADPQNGRAYAIGSWWLKQRDRGEALGFVEEGLRNNPEHFQLWYTYGVLQFEQGRALHWDVNPDAEVPEAAQAFFDQAKEACLKATELGLGRRPAGWVPEDEDVNDLWTLYEEEDLRAAARFAVLIERNYGDKRKALALAMDLDKRLDGDGILERQIHRVKEMLNKGVIEAASFEEWERRIRRLDDLAETASHHADELDEAAARTLAQKLFDESSDVAALAFPPSVKNPVDVELAQIELGHAIENREELLRAPLPQLIEHLKVFHDIAAKLIRASGLTHEHGHEHDHDHD